MPVGHAAPKRETRRLHDVSSNTVQAPRDSKSTEASRRAEDRKCASLINSPSDNGLAIAGTNKFFLAPPS